MGITFAAKGAGRHPRKRRRPDSPSVRTFALKEGEWGIRLTADSKRLLNVELRLAKKARRTVLLSPRRPLITAQRMLQDYFREGKPLGKVRIDWALQSPFQRRVLRCVRRVPFGEVRSYGWLARQIRVPGGARACGQALKRNRFPLFIPCHRIVGTSGVGGFSCGVRLKERLLSHEQAFSQRKPL